MRISAEISDQALHHVGTVGLARVHPRSNNHILFLLIERQTQSTVPIFKFAQFYQIVLSWVTSQARCDRNQGHTHSAQRLAKSRRFEEVILARFQAQFPNETRQFGEGVWEAVGEEYLVRELVLREGILETQFGVVSLLGGVYVMSAHNMRSTVSDGVSRALPPIIILLPCSTNALSVAKKTVGFGEIANVELNCASFSWQWRHVNTEVEPLVVTARVCINPHEKVVHVWSDFNHHIQVATFKFTVKGQPRVQSGVHSDKINLARGSCRHIKSAFFGKFKCVRILGY